MTVKEKFELRDHVVESTGEILSVKVTNQIDRFMNTRDLKLKKDFQKDKMGIRGIYFILFGIIGIYSLFFIEGWVFTILMCGIGIYNLIHLFQDYVFYHNNFRNIESHKKGKALDVELKKEE